MDFNAILQGLVEHPTACFLVLTLFALAYFYRAREADKKTYDERVDKLNDAHIATLEKVIPVADKLADGVAIIERLMEKV